MEDDLLQEARKNLARALAVWPVVALVLFFQWEPHTWLIWSALASFMLWLALSPRALLYGIAAALGLSLGLGDD
ncbi:MAG: hypothetical protein ACREU9_03560 [Gammaproteobacteria bacterium]